MSKTVTITDTLSPWPKGTARRNCQRCKGLGVVPTLISDEIDGPTRRVNLECDCIEPASQVEAQ